MRRKPFKKIALGLGLLLLVILPIYFLTIANLDISSNAPCFNLQSLENLKGKNFLLINKEGLSSEILKKNFCVGKITFIYQFSRKIKVVMEKREPQVVVLGFKTDLNLDYAESTASSASALVNFSIPQVVTEKFLADQEGVIYQKGDLDNLVPFYYDKSPLILGEKLNFETFSFLNEVINFLKINNLYSEVKFIKKIDNDILISGKMQIIISTAKPILRQLASLQLILEKAKINQQEVFQVDLRFDKPIVIFGLLKK